MWVNKVYTSCKSGCDGKSGVKNSTSHSESKVFGNSKTPLPNDVVSTDWVSILNLYVFSPNITTSDNDLSVQGLWFNSQFRSRGQRYYYFYSVLYCRFLGSGSYELSHGPIHKSNFFMQKELSVPMSTGIFGTGVGLSKLVDRHIILSGWDIRFCVVLHSHVSMELETPGVSNPSF